MIVRAGIGQWPERASARALDLPGGPVLPSDTGSDRPSHDQLFGAGNAARRIEPAINWRASRAIPSLAVTLTRRTLRAILIQARSFAGQPVSTSPRVSGKYRLAPYT